MWEKKLALFCSFSLEVLGTGELQAWDTFLTCLSYATLVDEAKKKKQQIVPIRKIPKIHNVSNQQKARRTWVVPIGQKNQTRLQCTILFHGLQL